MADAVLYEGYVLYPYRASAPKNQVRWQWGVLMPADVVARDESERSWNRTDLVVDGRATSVRATVRFLQVQRRERSRTPPARRVERLDAGDVVHVPWDEAGEHEHAARGAARPDRGRRPSRSRAAARSRSVDGRPAGAGRASR